MYGSLLQIKVIVVMHETSIEIPKCTDKTEKFQLHQKEEARHGSAHL